MPKKPDVPKQGSSTSLKITNYCFNDYIDANVRAMNPVLNRYYNTYKKDDLAVMLNANANNKNV